MLFLPEHELANGVFCFTTSTLGGVSNDAYKSFNVGNHVGDNQDRVATNRHLLQAIITQQTVNRRREFNNNDAVEIAPFIVAPLKWLPQGHSSNIVDYDDVETSSDGEIAAKVIDGVYTLSTATPLAVMTADCLPIMLACNKTGKIAAVHAGWRGLVDGFLNKVVSRFESPLDVNVWIGPHISQDNFQVSRDIINLFSPYGSAVKEAMEKDKYLVSLSDIASYQLHQLGVNKIQISPVCTYLHKHCFSHRRSIHNKQNNTGRMATVIMRL